VREVSDKYAHRHFDHTIHIAFSHNEKWNLTQLEVSTIDKQGVLSNIAHIFYQLDIYLVNARISTMGERVEDVFTLDSDRRCAILIVLSLFLLSNCKCHKISSI
jgi:[protein-PII] uridylyltransferase